MIKVIPKIAVIVIDGLRFTVYGLRFTVYGLRFTVYGLIRFEIQLVGFHHHTITPTHHHTNFLTTKLLIQPSVEEDTCQNECGPFCQGKPVVVDPTSGFGKFL